MRIGPRPALQRQIRPLRDPCAPVALDAAEWLERHPATDVPEELLTLPTVETGAGLRVPRLPALESSAGVSLPPGADPEQRAAPWQVALRAKRAEEAV